MKKVLIHFCVGITFAVANGVRADELVVDNHERLSVVATNGDMTAESIFSAPKAAVIEQTGADALTLAVNAVQTRDKVPVRVLEGTLNVVPGTDPGLEQPACLQRAALWLDATQSDTLVPPDGATGDEVARWYDVRETFATSGQTTPDVCVLTRGMTAGAHFLDYANAWGGIQLALYGTSASITSSAFTLPAGTWRLRCRMGGMYCSEGWKWNTKTANRQRNLQAWLVVDGVETSLGTTGNYTDPAMVTATFNAPVTFDTDKTVQLRVAQVATEASTAVPCAIIDDLEFVRQDLHGGTALAETFETTAGWTFTQIRDGTPYTSKSESVVRDPCRAVPSANQTYPYAYGLMYGVNKKALEMTQCGTAEKQVSFSEAGTYRLDFSSRARVWIYVTPSMNYAGNQVAFYLVDANNVTNEFYRSPSIYSTNFVFRSALFNVLAAGTYTFGIRSLNGWPLEDGSHLKVGATASDVTTFIDQVLIRKADEAAEPDLPEKLALDLSDGTRLRLDFAGTNRIDQLRFNGRSVSGFIDASHPSGLVSGIGCLEVRPKGTVLMLR